MICSSLNRFFTSNLPPGLDSKPIRYSKAGGRRGESDRVAAATFDQLAQMRGDLAFEPADGTLAQVDWLRERAFSDALIDRGTRKPGAGYDGRKP